MHSRATDSAIPIWEAELNGKRGTGTVIAERVLQSSKLTTQVRVRIGSPQKTTSGDFITPYQILGAGDEKVRFAAGLDSIQSLQLVLQMIGADIHYRLKSINFGGPTVTIQASLRRNTDKELMCDLTTFSYDNPKTHRNSV